jgi:4-diphosphocytidyl-2-C-methyl-D-erythritol kinase
MATTVRSYAKINLGLRIGPPRPDGFHHLHTLYQTIGLHDTITVTATRADATEIRLASNDVRLPTDSRNTVHRMISAALVAMQVTARVHVHLQKTLPIQGGLGAGSANAAVALLALEHELGTSLLGPQRLLIAERVGSDVPLFLIGGTVYGHNRGEIVLPYPDIPSTPCVIVAAGVGSSTPAAFRAWDERIGALTPEAATGRLNELSRVYASAFTPAGQRGFLGGNLQASQTGASGASGALDAGINKDLHESGSLAGNPLPALVQTGIENDFEDVVFLQHPFLRNIKRALAGEDGLPEEQRALCASLSGSGSSLFGLYRSEPDAVAAQQRAQALGVKAFVTTTLTRSEYWRTLFL